MGALPSLSADVRAAPNVLDAGRIDARIFIGTAGWSIPRASAHRFAQVGTHLERYAGLLPCVEINSSFHRSHLRATYTKSRDPKWDASIYGPPENLDVGGVLRTSKHWLVLQASDAYLILRLEDSNFRQILEVVAKRTNVPIDRPASKDN